MLDGRFPAINSESLHRILPSPGGEVERSEEVPHRKPTLDMKMGDGKNHDREMDLGHSMPPENHIKSSRVMNLVTKTKKMLDLL